MPPNPENIIYNIIYLDAVITNWNVHISKMIIGLICDFPNDKNSEKYK